MIICCCCSTYQRPMQVGYIVHMFQKQTHKDKRLLILDDGDSFTVPRIREENWQLVTIKARLRSLASKRNKCFHIAMDLFPESEAIVTMDDDDIYFPWHLELHDAALQHCEWSIPSRVLYLNPDGSFRQHLTGPGDFYHAGMAWRREVFEQVKGYPDGWSGPEDRELFARFRKAGIMSDDPLTTPSGGVVRDPSYCYGTNDGLLHISSNLRGGSDTGEDAYRIFGEQAYYIRQDLTVESPPGIDLDHPRILPGFLPRPF